VNHLSESILTVAHALPEGYLLSTEEFMHLPSSAAGASGPHPFDAKRQVDYPIAYYGLRQVRIGLRLRRHLIDLTPMSE